MTHQNRNRFTPEIEMLESREVPSTFAYSNTDYTYSYSDSDTDAYKVSSTASRTEVTRNLNHLLFDY